MPDTRIIIGNAPDQPIHPNCRCIMVPVMADMEIEYQSSPNYQDWLSRRSDAELLDILGPARMKMYLSGYTIDRFVRDNRVVTLKELGQKRLARKTVEAQRAAGLIPDRVRIRGMNRDFQNYFRDMRDRIGNVTWEELTPEFQQMINNRLKEQGINLTGKEFLQQMDDIVRNGQIVRHQDMKALMDNIESLERDPRIKTLFETGRSEGHADARIRQAWEETIARKAPETHALLHNIQNKEKITRIITENHAEIGGIKNRPSYGELIPRGQPVHERGASGYGGFHMILNPEMRSRTTFTPANSSTGVGSFFKHPSSMFSVAGQNSHATEAREALDFMINLYQRAQGQPLRGYTEAQFWGGIDFSRGDVSEVIISQTDFDNFNGNELQRVLNLFRTYNIGVRVLK